MSDLYESVLRRRYKVERVELTNIQQKSRSKEI